MLLAVLTKPNPNVKHRQDTKPALEAPEIPKDLVAQANTVAAELGDSNAESLLEATEYASTLYFHVFHVERFHLQTRVTFCFLRESERISELK